MMRRFAVLLPLAVCATTPAFAADKAIEAPIQKFLVSFNKGDMKGAATTMTTSVSITDEFSPFHWAGKGAFATWAANYDADAKVKHITDPAVEIGAATRIVTSGTLAYVVTPATYRFTQKGVKMVEVAQMTFQLKKLGTAWKISAWTWTGPDATPE